MRKLACLALLAGCAVLAWADESSACGRHRAACCQPVYYAPCYQPVIFAPCYPVVVMPAPATPAAAPTKQVKLPKGRTVTVIATNERGFVDQVPPLSPTAAVSKDAFVGNDRKASKTSISQAPVKSFENLPALVATLPAEDKMLNHVPVITKAADSTRVTEEDRNVTVNAFLYAVKSETDHDFHVIIGNEPDAENRVFLNVEVSGLPASASPDFARLKAVRDKFKAFFASTGVEIGSGYTKFAEGIPVRVTGSLFFDIDHDAGVVGPTGMRPATAWEIHPVTDIVFEP